jgi:IS30 family transposase
MEPTLANAQFSCPKYKAARLTRNVVQSQKMKPDRNLESERNVRDRIIEVLELISSPEDQIEYQKKVPHIHIPFEIIEQWYDWVNVENKDYYKLDVYTSEELEAIWKFDAVWDSTANKMDDSLTIEELIISEPWKQMIESAKEALQAFNKNAQPEGGAYGENAR